MIESAIVCRLTSRSSGRVSTASVDSRASMVLARRSTQIPSAATKEVCNE